MISISAGTYSESGASKCETCAAGKNCGSMGLTEQIDCNSGHSCKDPAHPKQCNPGYYQPLPGQGIWKFIDHDYVSLDHCKICEKGHYCDSTGMTEQKQCEDGTVSTTEGKKKCDECPAGSFCTHSGHGSINKNQIRDKLGWLRFDRLWNRSKRN